MRIAHQPFLFLHTLALVTILVQGRVREVDALKLGPASVIDKLVIPHRRIAKHVRQPSSYYANRQQQGRPSENSNNNSMRTNLAHGNIGVPEGSQRKTSVTKRNAVLAAVFAAALWKPKGLLSFLATTLYTPYQNSLVANPLVTKVITGAILAMCGDAMAQASSDAEAYDKRRALSFAVFDMAYRVFQHNMFPAIIRAGTGNVVSKLLPMLTPAAAAIEQTAMYQFLVVPCIYYPAFFAFTGFIQGLSLQQSVDRLKDQFFRCWRRNLMFWIPMQMVLFGLIAENWQIPFACVAGMVWSTILSKTAGNTKKR